ncbi:hypothetical protein B0A49_03289 [Cryomyces minteri]|uniref:U3 small nucleolar RNA-associated protein 25 n=1 Tax=Cryomyces minteri TaxID=331657 RepID=A0A4U0XFT6_9PEZI|nr:hypothetical protein B0A49_03289 [Cryomyces minteri]
MALIRGKGGFRSRGQGRGRGSGRGGRGRGGAGFGSRRGRRDSFTTARVEDPEEEGSENGERREESPTELEEDAADLSDESVGENGGSAPDVRPYNALLQSLQQSAESDEPRRKKRKVEERNRYSHQRTPSPEAIPAENLDEALVSEPEDEDGTLEASPSGAEDLDDEDDKHESFEKHFANPDETHLKELLQSIAQNDWKVSQAPAWAGRKGNVTMLSVPGASDEASTAIKRPSTSPKDLDLKQRLTETSIELIPRFDELERFAVPYVFNYMDFLFCARAVDNAAQLRRLTCLHALNHIFKGRDRVLKSNARLTRAQEPEDLELRDRGFTRPKILMLLETRQACVKAIETIMSLCKPEQQENKKRFQDEYVHGEEKFSPDRPDDFRELFEGNDDNDFRLGLKFTRKTIRYFSPFYSSDIIFASPLGLRRIIDNEDPKKVDYDFLSSIEVAIVDQADAMLMQNWEHVEYVLDHLNRQPKDAHGCDFSRVRSWYLDGNAKYLRQTIMLSAYNTPELNRLFNIRMLNIAGKAKFQPEYDGAMLDIGLQIKQTFSRYESFSLVADPDARFKHFTTAIVPSLTRYPRPADGAGGQGILIFIPSYLDFVRLRNYFASSTATANLSFGAVSEYTPESEVRRAKSHFFTGRHSVLLYSGRAHHFHRYRIRGVKRVIMYALPDNPVFYNELVGGYLGATVAEGKAATAETSVRAVFSRWDGLRLERVVGSKRVRSMLQEKSGDTFDFL